MAKQKVLVTGALGVIGRAVVERLAARKDVQVVGLARRAPDDALVDSLRDAPNAVTWVRCDLQDAAATRAALDAAGDFCAATRTLLARAGARTL